MCGVCVWLCVVVCGCVLGGEGRGGGVYASNTSPCAHSQCSPCVHSKRPPCVHSKKRHRLYWHHAHMFYTCGRGAGTRADVLNVHTRVFQRVTPQHHNTTTPHTHTTTPPQHHPTPPYHHTRHSTQHNTTPPHTHHTKKNGGVELAAQFASTRENSPGLDTVRIDRLFALS